MKNKGMNRDIVFGVLSIITSVSVLIVSIIMFVIDFIGSIGHFGRIFETFIYLVFGLVFCGFCLWIGILVMARVARYKKYSRIIGNSPRFRVPALAAALRKSERIVSTELCSMISMGYFSGSKVDLENKEFVIDPNSEPLAIPDNESKTMYVQHKEFSVLPLLTAVVVFGMTYSRLGRVGFIVGGLLGIIAFCITFRFFPTKIYYTEAPYKTQKTKVQEKSKSKSENTELDNFFEICTESRAEFEKVSRGINGSLIKNSIKEILHSLDEIVEKVNKDNDDVKQLRQFMNYYLPTTVKLMQSYEELWKTSVKGENIRQSMLKIESMVDKIAEVFKQEYDKLFGSKAMDISAEVAVMQDIIDGAKQENPFN